MGFEIKFENFKMKNHETIEKNVQSFIINTK
jgi:hypothetical protein